MRVLLDTNILLDSILQRAPWHAEADAILQADARGQVNCAATTLSLATVFYVARKAVGTLVARGAVQKCLAALAILPVDKQTLVDADALAGTDFEDNIIIAASVAASVDAIITRNVADFAQSHIPVWEPAELLKRLATAGLPPGAAGGAPFPTLKPTFTWTPVTDAGSYDLEVISSAGHVIVQITNIKGASYTLQRSLKKGQSCTWKVAAVSTNGKSRSWSMPLAFTTT
jgi:predicted nucleic acid-binding protein